MAKGNSTSVLNLSSYVIYEDFDFFGGLLEDIQILDYFQSKSVHDLYSKRLLVLHSLNDVCSGGGAGGE